MIGHKDNPFVVICIWIFLFLCLAVLCGSCATLAAADDGRVVTGTRRNPAAVADEPVPPVFPTVTAIDFAGEVENEGPVFILISGPVSAIVELTLYEDGFIGSTVYPAVEDRGDDDEYLAYFEEWLKWLLNREVGPVCEDEGPEPRWQPATGGMGRLLTGTALLDAAAKWRTAADDDDVPGYGDWRPGGVCYTTYVPFVQR